MPPELTIDGRGIVLAVTAGDELIVQSGDDLQRLHRHDQRLFLETIGSDRLCLCDDALALVAGLAGEAPAAADLLWKPFDECRVIDVRALQRAIVRTRASCPSVPDANRRGSVERRLADLQNLMTSTTDELALADYEASQTFGPFGSGHDTRVAVAMSIADRHATSLHVQLPDCEIPYQTPAPVGINRANRFVAERFSHLHDWWDEPLPRPLDERDQYSLDPRDWGLATEADPKLRLAREEWARRQYESSRLGGAQSRKFAESAKIRGYQAVDFGGLRRNGAMVLPPPDHYLLRVQLDQIQLRCYAVLGRQRHRPHELWVDKALKAKVDPAVAFVRKLASQNLSAGTLPSVYERSTEQQRIGIVQRLIEAILGGFSEDCTARFIAASLPPTEQPPNDELKSLVRDIRWRLLGEERLGLNSYLETDVIGRIAGVVTQEAFMRVTLSRELRRGYSEKHPTDDHTKWEQRVARTFLGQSAGRGDPDNFWKILYENATGDRHRQYVKEAQNNPAWVKQILSASPSGLTGRVGRRLPVWQVRPAEIALANQEILGTIAYALVRSGNRLAAIDGGEFVCLVSANGSTVPNAEPWIEAALNSLVRNEKLARLVTSGLASQRIERW